MRSGLTPNRWKGEAVKIAGVRPRPQLMACRRMPSVRLTAATDRVFVVLKGPRRGEPLSADGLDEIITGARARAGLAHGTCHELRHTCLTRLREHGMSIEALQAQAGHRSIASTQLYLHLGDGWLAAEYRRAAEAIEAQASVGMPR